MPQGERSVPLGGVPRGGPPLGDSLVTFSSGRKSPGCRAERLHWGPQGLPAPHKLPGRGAERPPRNKHTPGTARQAVGPRTKPIRESGAASCRREMGAGSACRRELRPGSAPSDRISAIKCPLRERKTKTKSRAQNANCVQAQPGGQERELCEHLREKNQGHPPQNQ